MNTPPDNTYKYLTSTIGMKFSEYRKKSGLSLRYIYRTTNISMAVVSDLENGKKLPRVKTLLKLLHIVGMPYAEVFNTGVTPNQEVKKVEITDFLLSHNYSKREIIEITAFMDYTIKKRNSKS